MTGRAAQPVRARSGVTWLIHAAFLILAWVAAALLPPAPAAGAAPPLLETEKETEYARATVMLDGEPLFAVSGVMAYPAEKRASVIAGRIQAVAADPSIRVDSLRVVQTEHGSDILAGDRFLMTVAEIDTKSEGVSHQLMARAVQRRRGGDPDLP